MRKRIVILFFIISSNLSAQFCTNDGRFTNDPFFSDAEINTQYNITYGNAIDWQGNSVPLRMDAYYPSLSIDTLPLRPLIIMVHGGGLISGDKSNYTRVCREFAKRGFVALSINYRLGLNCATDTISEEKAKYRAQQDIHAAFRYVTQNAAVLRVDTSWMFIGGGSAGSVASLGIVYLNQSEWNSYTPGIQTLLGDLNTSGNALTNTFSIKGIFNDWGAMLKSSIQPHEMLPMVSFHGDADSTVNVDSTFGGGCVLVEKSYGSRAMHNLLIDNGVCSDLSVRIGGGHGVYQDSIFGTPFRVGRASCFFRSLFCNNCSSFYQTDSTTASCALTSSIPGHMINSETLVYPNPFTNQINLLNGDGSETLFLTNQLGQVFYSGKAIQENDFSTLPKGVYILQIRSNTYTQNVKLMKE
jgi:alpha/beta hydrolase fold/Secretion system C-terminal sorting domain